MNNSFLKESPQGVLLSIRVTPKASRNALGDSISQSSGQTELKIFVTAPAEDNKANQAVIDLLSKTLKIPKKNLSLLSGHTSRHKVIAIQEKLSLKEVENRLFKDKFPLFSQ